MTDFLSLLRIAIEQGWKLGILFIVFFGGALIANHYGVLAMQKDILEWSGAGFLFGVAVAVLSAAINLSEALKGARQRRRHQRERIQEEQDDAREVTASLSTLSRSELEIVRDILANPRVRYEIQIGSEAWPLLKRGIFSLNLVIWVVAIFARFIRC